MTLLKQPCVNHPDRAAICECVLTRKPICAECSTRYEGVNYSKEGLAALKLQRAAAAKKAGGRLAMILVIALCPLLIYAHYLFFNVASSLLIDLQQIDLDRL